MYKTYYVFLMLVLHVVVYLPGGKNVIFFLPIGTWCTLDVHVICYLDNTTVEVKYEQHSVVHLGGGEGGAPLDQILSPLGDS